MLAAADSRGMLRVEQSLKSGERVRLTAGAFAEQLGIIVSLNDSNRIRVLLEMMGGQIAVEVPREFVMTAA
jgi:transcriptional antiterminator RfaH